MSDFEDMVANEEPPRVEVEVEPKKSVTVPSGPVVDPVSAESTATTIAELEARIDVLETLLIEAFQFAANELRPLFGQGTLALVFDGVADGLQKGVKK